MADRGAALGVGIIGLSAAGGWASLAHVPALAAQKDDFRITGLTASTKAKADAAAELNGVAFASDDPAALAAHPDVDLITVAVKVTTHKELVAHAIRAGKPVYCEWPLGRSLAEAEEMADAAAAANIPAFVGLQARSAPAVRYLRDLVMEGFVGDVISTSVLGCGGFPWGGSAITGIAYVLDQNSGGTMLTIPFGHMVDSFCWILGPFEQISATLATRHPRVRLLDQDDVIEASAPDQVALSGVLASGAVASLHYRGLDDTLSNFRWEINGSEGSLLIEGDTGHFQYGHLRISGKRGGEVLAKLEVPDQYRQVACDPDGYADAVAHAYRAVKASLVDGMAGAPTFTDAVETHRLLDWIERSANCNKARK